ncbi:hypothetical protein FRB95_006744 [Tulasnella sp. JGI-2019a]|nr:hypothetical protein FRB95_006744 [Tulasnella sp. JGI-2019a]
MMSQVVSAALPTSAASPPTNYQTYLLEWSDQGRGFSRRNVDIIQTLLHALSSRRSSITSSTPMLQTVSSEDDRSGSSSSKSTLFNPFAVARCEQITPSKELRGDRVYQIRHLKWNSTSYELLEVADMATDELAVSYKKLMAIQQESKGSFESTFTYDKGKEKDISSAPRSVSMYKFKGKGGERFWSSNRSLDDFDGVQYKVRTTFLGDIIITKSDDLAEVARFTRAKGAVHEIGKLEIRIPVSESLLYLLLCTTFMKYLRDRAIRMGRITSSS